MTTLPGLRRQREQVDRDVGEQGKEYQDLEPDLAEGAPGRRQAARDQLMSWSGSSAMAAKRQQSATLSRTGSATDGQADGSTPT